MDESKNFNLTIKRGTIEFKVNRRELISSDETADGMVFKFKGGVIFTIDDINMPLDVKQRVCAADSGFKKGNIIFDLNDYRNPVSLSL